MILAEVSEGGWGWATNLVLGSWAGCEKQWGEGHEVWLQARNEVCFLENAEGRRSRQSSEGSATWRRQLEADETGVCWYG